MSALLALGLAATAPSAWQAGIVHHSDPAVEADALAQNKLALDLLSDDHILQIFAPELRCRTTVLWSNKAVDLKNDRDVEMLGAEIKNACLEYARSSDEQASSYASASRGELPSSTRTSALCTVVRNLIRRNLEHSYVSKGKVHWLIRYQVRHPETLRHDNGLPSSLMAR